MIFATLEISENNEHIDHYFIRSLVNVLHCKDMNISIRSKKKFDLLVDEPRIDSEYGGYEFKESKLNIIYSSFSCEIPLDRPIEKVIENVEEIYSLLLTSNYMKDDNRLSFLKRDVEKYLDDEFKIETQKEEPEPIIKDRTMVVIYNEVDSQASAKMFLSFLKDESENYELDKGIINIESNYNGFRNLYRTSHYLDKRLFSKEISKLPEDTWPFPVYENRELLSDKFLYFGANNGTVMVKYNSELDTYKQSVFRIVGERKPRKEFMNV
jgi:hypothetical protein